MLADFAVISRVRARWLLAALAGVMTVTACSDSPTGPTTPIGSYALASVGADLVPATIFEDEGYKFEWLRGTLEVEADSSFVAALVRLETVDNNESEYVDSLTGSWRFDTMGALQFTITSSGGSVIMPGSWLGRKITVLYTEEFMASSLTFERTN